MPKIAISYQRWSSKAQDEGDSRRRQSTSAQEYADRKGLVLDTVYTDAGVSAFKGKNSKEGALGKFLAAVDEGLIPNDVTLIVESLDRISRANILDALQLFIGIVNRGITLVTIKDHEKVYTRDAIISDGGMMLFGSIMVMSRAHEESATKSMRGKEVKAAKLAQGFKHGKVPKWLKVTPDRRGFTIVEDEAQIVREVFKMRAEAIGSMRIARHLNQAYGWKWSTPQVARLLKNPAVIGTRISQAGLAPLLDYYPPILSKAEFYDVQRLMDGSIGTKRGRRAEDEPNIFTGLLFCGHCGSRLRFFRASKTVSQRYLKCVSALDRTGCEHRSFINYDAFEKEVIGWLLLDQEHDYVALLDKKPTVKVVVSAELKALKEQQARLIDLVADGLMNPALVREKLNALEMQIQHHETAVVEPEADVLMFEEKAWALVERHEEAELAVADGEPPDELYAVRRELKAAFHRSVERFNVFTEERVKDEHIGKFSVRFRGYEDGPVRQYKRPALICLIGAKRAAYHRRLA
ncbi:recombinase family protein [Variovorax sp. Sphag1AA]|uniref:recombinase family protein n=1 Tax=Variovorax sp. Sphag1AA TaxID=2587027 RepID=UPI00161E383B|nr:recombinase family protein [Variovorax sp. Sphag1AA]MBB3177925.1 DNA invertase Pin-like site-specific DNA recombinase [Variovorax sp. Sphag1AA]